MMFMEDAGIEAEQQVIDLFVGEQYGEAFSSINPSCFVPVLEDGDFRMIESSAILKYLADLVDSPAYPKDLKARARVNERMDWVNTNFYRAFGYGLVYPQVLDMMKLPDPTAQKLQLEAGLAAAKRFLGVLNDHLLKDRPWLCGDDISIADYLGSGIISLGAVIGCTFADYPNVAAWYARLQVLPNWQSANGAVYYWAEQAAGGDYVTV